MKFNKEILLLLIFLSIMYRIFSFDRIIRGTEYDEIYVSTKWYSDSTYPYGRNIILHSFNNGDTFELVYKDIIGETQMPIQYLVPDATPGYFYNYSWSGQPYGLWVTWDYGVDWYYVDPTSYGRTYIGGCIQGEVYKRYQGNTFISNDYGQNFVQIPSSPTVGVSDVGHTSGELYGRTGGLYNSDLSIYHSMDYGATYTQQSHFEAFELGNSYKDLIRGAISGEVYLVMNAIVNNSVQYNIYFSNDYGQTFTLQQTTNIPDLFWWNPPYFTTGTRPGSFYIMMDRSDQYEQVNTELKILYSSDYAQTFTEYYHFLDLDYFLPVQFSSFTAIQTLEAYVKLTWITQSEANLIGFNVYKNNNDDFDTSEKINSSIISATNTTMEQSYFFIDQNTSIGKTYYYWVESINFDGTNKIHGSVSCKIKDDIVSEFPQKTFLKNACPNPFNPETKIEFSVKEGDKAKLFIYNLKGKIVRTYPEFTSGTYSIIWKGKNNQGNKVSSGIYLYELKSFTNKTIKKMLMLK